MKQSEKNIRAYKAILPHMKERVIAAVSLLAVAITMMASVTYAWFVLSQSPEVAGLQTTISANGNLEIALATGEVITIPADSKVGDGALDLVAKNITWGNLINLGDPAYGLEHIVLRPAALNTNKLLESPLYAASYGKDGRVEMLDSDFAYAYWDQDTFTADPAKFKYGVRAISSVTYGQAPGQNLALADAVSKAEQSTKQSQLSMQMLARHDALQDLVGLMGAYVQAQIDEKLGGGSEPFIYVTPDQIESMYYLMGELKSSIELSATALADIYNMEMLRRSDQAFVAENKFTSEYLLSETQANIQNKLKIKNSANEAVVQPSMLSYLWQLRTDYNTVIADMAVLETYRGRDDVVYRNLNGSTYPAVETYVNHIADVGTCTINGTAIGKLSMSNISSLTGTGTKPIVIHKGIIQRMDKFTGAQLKSNSLSVTIKVPIFGSSTATGQATTSATGPYVLPSEQENALSGDTSYKGSNPIAADTFGLALDFWVRTNATGAQLTLAGNPVYESVEQAVLATIDGKNYTLYTVTKTVEGQTGTSTAYFNDSDNTYYLYDRETNTAGDALGKESDFTNIEPLTEMVTTIVGYHGVNRVWDDMDSTMIDDNSTTMGAGCCYVFYPQSPEDQAKSLQLLQNLKLAFIDQYGTLLGQAVMDTANAYEQPGKVTVPIVCDITNSSVFDIDGNPLYYITDLEANTPTLITTLLYLDGMNLTNDQVLAAGDIQGHLNLQFSTTADLTAMSDPVLMQEKCKVTALMEGNNSVSIDAPAADRTKTVTVHVEGYEPKSVVAYFLREINSTQGIRQGKMTFVPDGNGNWVASYPFTASGKYILREVQLDGVTYTLDQDPLTFTVEGFTIGDIYCEHHGKTFMTADRSFDTTVSLTFSTNDVSKMPTSVKGAFIHTETKNRTTVNFTRTTGSTWTGAATFTTSGEYEMTYLELDGEYTGLPEDDYINFNLYLGLTASVYTGDTNFGLENGESRDVSMSLLIRTDGGAVIGNLPNVWLQYADNDSDVPEDGVGAGMVWNSTREMYEGTFHLTKSGIYDYRYVSIKVGDDLNYLNRADVAPTITAISTTVPVYVSKDGFGNSFSLGSDATFSIRMANADSATIDAKLTDAAGNVYYVRGVSSKEGGEQIFTFTIPVVDGKQSGTWTLEGIYLTNVYGGANNALINAPTANGPDTFTDDKPLYTVADNYYDRWWAWSVADITNEGESAPVVTISNQINISFTNNSTNASKEFGKDAEGNVTGAFGTNYALGNLELQVLADGKPLSEYGMTLSSVKLEYKFDQNASFSKVNNTTSKNNYGNYNVNASDIGSLIAGDQGTIEYTLGSGADGLYQLTTTNTGLSVAGVYKADPNSMKLVVTTSNGNTVELPVEQSVVAAAPTYMVYSAKPTATVSGYSGAAHQEKITYTGGTCSDSAPTFAEESDSSTPTGGIDAAANKAILYADAKPDNSTQHNGSYTLPKLSVTIAGISSDSAASFILPANGKATAVTFSRTGNGTISSVEIGKQQSIKTWKTLLGALTHTQYAYYGHGNQTIDQLTVTKGGITFTFTLDKPITIVNPSSVNQS